MSHDAPWIGWCRSRGGILGHEAGTIVESVGEGVTGRAAQLATDQLEIASL